MAKQRRELLPISDEEREQLLVQLQSAVSPLMAKEIASQCRFSRKVSEAEVGVLLSGFIETGRLFLVPGKTAKAKPRYWGRDPSAAARESITAAIQQSDAPLTLKQLAKPAGNWIAATEEALRPILDELLSAGVIHEIPATTAKGKLAYWRETRGVWAETIIRQSVKHKGAQPESTLRKAVKWLSNHEFEEVIQLLVARNELFRSPALGKIKSLLSAQSPSPEPYLREIGVQLKKTVDLLRSAQIPEVQLRRAIVQCVEGAGITINAERVADSSHQNEVDLIRLMQAIEPGALQGALVSIRDLRRSAKCSKESFDQTLLGLSRQGELALHRHDFPASLSEDERNDLVRDGNGIYYVGAALRQNR